MEDGKFEIWFNGKKIRGIKSYEIHKDQPYEQAVRLVVIFKEVKLNLN